MMCKTCINSKAAIWVFEYWLSLICWTRHVVSQFTEKWANLIFPVDANFLCFSYTTGPRNQVKSVSSRRRLCLVNYSYHSRACCNSLSWFSRPVQRRDYRAYDDALDWKLRLSMSNKHDLGSCLMVKVYVCPSNYCHLLRALSCWHRAWLWLWIFYQ